MQLDLQVCQLFASWKTLFSVKTVRSPIQFSPRTLIAVWQVFPHSFCRGGPVVQSHVPNCVRSDSEGQYSNQGSQLCLFSDTHGRGHGDGWYIIESHGLRVKEASVQVRMRPRVTPIHWGLSEWNLLKYYSYYALLLQSLSTFICLAS